MPKTDISPIAFNKKKSEDNLGFQDDVTVIEMSPRGNSVALPPLTNNGKIESGSSKPQLRRKISQATCSTLSAHDISYTVKVKKRFYSRAKDKQILFNVTGIFKPGMNAILGPTGCGKSSFLDLLAGRVDYKMVQGKLLLNGKPTPENFKCMVGYVVQDDVVMGTLTVRENFAFSAALRLHSSISAAERRERVEQVIKELGLTKCANTKVGTETTRGVSGGERKRCNIGMELIIRPPVLFLDEPTTGLDANTANTVLGFLKRLSERGRTIIFSIHQPRYSIYRQFDNLMLLSAGHTVYHGPAEQALEFFQQQGYVCQAHNNPPDFFLDVIMGDPSTKGDGALKETTEYDNVTADEDKDKTQAQTTHNSLVEGFRASAWYQSLQEESNDIYTQYEKNPSKDAIARINYATPISTQMRVVSIRTLKNIIRNPQTGATTFLTVLFFSAIVSAIFNNISDDPETAFSDRKGCLFFLLMNQIFLNMAAVEIFIGERTLFLHENVSGFYRVSVYFFVKIFCDILPLRLLPVLINASIVYYIVGFRPDVEYFFMFVLTLFALTISATSLCFLYAAVFKVFAITQLLLSVTYVLMVLFSGFLVSLDSIGEWLRWLKYFSAIRYAMENLYINEFKDREFCNAKLCVYGNDTLDAAGIDYKDDFDFWENFIAMMVFSVIVFILTFLSLLVTKKHR